MQRTKYDYVAYDSEHTEMQGNFKKAFIALDEAVESALPSGRYKELVFIKLEEAYMYIGKAIRDRQIAIDQGTKLQEGRNEG